MNIMEVIYMSSENVRNFSREFPIICVIEWIIVILLGKTLDISTFDFFNG